MTDKDFLDDLAEQLRNELKIEPPQERDEFTSRWFATNVLRAGIDTARIHLEKKVTEGVVTVRRHVTLTWGSKPGRTVSDVYKLNAGNVAIKLQGKKNQKRPLQTEN